jgi:biopolymer transport protein TolR
MIFMVNGPSPHANRSPVDLARTDHGTPMPGALREDAILVAVTRDGNVFFGTHQIQRSDLCLAIQDSLRHGSERKVYLKVDTRARYGDATSVFDQVRSAGVQNVGIITAQRSR